MYVRRLRRTVGDPQRTGCEIFQLFSSLKFFLKITKHIYRKPVPEYSLLPTLKQLICV